MLGKSRLKNIDVSAFPAGATAFYGIVRFSVYGGTDEGMLGGKRRVMVYGMADFDGFGDFDEYAGDF